MKQVLTSKMLALLLACMALLPFYSCSGGSDLYQYSSSDDLVVVSGNAQTIIDNAGCTLDKNGIQLSSSLQTLMSQLVPSARDREAYQKVLAIQGADLNRMVLAVSSNLEITLTFKITNQKNFKAYIESISYGTMKESEEKGYTVYDFDAPGAIFINNNVATLMFSANKRVNVNDIITLKDRVSKAPLQSWQKKALEAGSTFNFLLSYGGIKEVMNKYDTQSPFDFKQFSMMYDPEQLATAYLTIQASLDGVKLSGQTQVLTKDGKQLESKIKGAEVNLDLLKYANDKDIMLFIGAVPGGQDYSQLLKSMINEMGGPSAFGLDAETIGAIGAVLNNLDGSVMLAAGPIDGMKALASPEGCTAVLAAEMKEGMAQHYVEMVKSFVDIQNEHMSSMAADYQKMGLSGYRAKTIETSYTDGKLSIKIPQGGTVNIQAIGNDFVAALGPITTDGGCKIDTTPLKGSWGGFIIDLPHYNAFSSLMSFPFGINLTSVSYPDKTTFSLSETETEGLLLDNIFKFVASQMH